MTAARKKATEYYQYLSEWPRERGPVPTDDDLEQAFALLLKVSHRPKRADGTGTREALAVAGYLGRYWDVDDLGDAVAKATRHPKPNTWRNVIKELVDADLVTRHKQPDGRLSITLTDKGEKVVADYCATEGIEDPVAAARERQAKATVGTPTRPTPEILPEILEVENVASGYTRRGRAQGFGLSPLERHAVEMHAMTLAKAHLKRLGWRVGDVHSTHPYDFECTRGSEELIVEVKGTTSTGEQIVVTRNEVAIQRARHPNNALIVVHSINLTGSSVDPKVVGGELLMWCPWAIEESRLSPLAFQYRVGLDDLA
jgi:hypothetical protein